MGEVDAEPVSVSDVVEYCRTQARLLSGTVETLGEDIDELLDDIDSEIDEIRSALEDQTGTVSEPPSPSATVSPSGSCDEIDLEAIEQVEQSLERKQTLVETKQVRMQAFQELAAGYTELAESIRTAGDDSDAALERVVRFEASNDAPAYFPDRETLVETATGSENSS